MNDRVVIRVRDVMKTQFDMVDGMETISQALQKMKHVETKCLIVDKRWAMTNVVRLCANSANES